MNNEECKNLAVKKVIGILAEMGIKYRRNDFMRTSAGVNSETGKWEDANCIVTIKGNVILKVFLNDKKRGKALRSAKEKFYNYFNARVMNDYVQFVFTKKELELESIKTEDISDDKSEQIMAKIQKLLALSESDNEHEAISASLMAQKLLAKYNIDIENVTGLKEEEQEIEECQADVGTGNSWKYKLAGVVSRNYRCKHYYLGSESIIFHGYRADIVIARRVYMYLFSVAKRLGRNYEKEIRELYGSAEGIYNSFCAGFISGVDSELSKQCTELMIVIPKKIEEEYEDFSKGFGQKNTQININDSRAYEEGIVEGKRALNAQYIESE